MKMNINELSGSERTISTTLTGFADPFKIRFRLSVDDLLLTKFEKGSPAFDPQALLGEFSETFGAVVDLKNYLFLKLVDFCSNIASLTSICCFISNSLEFLCEILPVYVTLIYT